MSDAASVSIPHRRHDRRRPAYDDKLAAQESAGARFAVRDGDGEMLRFDGFSRGAILVAHGQPDPQVTTV